MSFRVKLIALFLLVGIVPLAAIAVISYTMASQNIEDEVFSAIDMFAGITDSQLDDYFAERYGDGRVLATTRDVYQSMYILQGGAYQGQVIETVGDLNDPMWRARVAILSNLMPVVVEEYGYSQVFLTDTDGRVVYDSLGQIVGADLSGRAYFQSAVAGRATWSEMFYSDVVYDSIMVLSTPVYSEGTRGAIIGTINITISADIIDALVHDGLDELADTADSYLIDANGLRYTNAKFGEFSSGSTLNRSINTRAVELLAAPIREGNMDFYAQDVYLDYVGDPVLGDSKPHPVADHSPRLFRQIDGFTYFCNPG